MPDIPLMFTSLTNREIRKMLGAELHGPLPKETMSRVFASLAELTELRDATEKMLKNCYPCSGTGKLSADFDFTGEGQECGACRELRQAWRLCGA